LAIIGYVRRVKIDRSFGHRERLAAEELALVASGQMLLPSKPFDERAFWSIGAKRPVSAELADSISRAVSEDREERDSEVLGL
jgi:hypothetical protein